VTDAGSPARIHDLIREVIGERIPFNRFLGIRATELREGFARLELPFRPEWIGNWIRPALHGGIISTLVDTSGGAAVMTLIAPRGSVATIDLRVDYLLPGEPQTLVCDSTVVRMGNRVASVDSRVYHPGATDRPIATGKAVYSVRRPTDRG
jgi:uncharacterized protein (TIGR00369 family)